MLKNLAANQKKVFSKSLYTVGQISSIFNDLKSKGDLLTAVLALEENDRALLLFVLQDDLYTAVELRGDQFLTISFSEYFKEMSQAKGSIHLYLTSPVFFKALLVLTQKKPNIVATSDIINIEDLLKQVEKKQKEAVLTLKKGEEINLFYFRKGRLSEGYFENPAGIKNEGALSDQLLVYAYSAAGADPMEVRLYYDLEVSPADDVEDAVEALKEGVEERLASRPCLVLSREGREIEKIIDQGLFTLGRDIRSDWALKDPMVSREHALIKQNPDGFYIEDRGSRNGVFVNKEKITVKKLSDGDEIRIGSSLFRFIERKSRGREPNVLSREDTGGAAQEGRPARPEEPVQVRWALEVLSGAESGKRFELAPQKLSLGRGKADISINDPKVSRHHADLEWTEEGFTITDLKSTNGVFVNNVKVEKKLLSPEDIIAVGSAQLKVVRKK